MTELNYTSELKSIDNLVAQLQNSTDIVRSVDSWLPDMKTYFNEHIGLTDEGGEEKLLKDILLEHIFFLFFIKMNHSLPLFLYVRLFYLNVQLVDKILPMLGFELWICNVGGNRYTN